MWLHQTRGCLLTGWEGGTDRERRREREREQSVLQSVTLALTQCHESPHHYSSDRTGALFKLKHLPGAECQQKGTYDHARDRKSSNNIRNQSVLSSYLSSKNDKDSVRICCFSAIYDRQFNKLGFWTNQFDYITLSCGKLYWLQTN